MDLKNYIATIENFPKKGIMFRDITPIMQHPEAFKYTIEQFAKFARENGATMIVGPEARGFMFGCPVAVECGLGFIPIRKPGKLPRETYEEAYSLEYGTNTLCMHKDALKPGDRVIIIDDLLATGGTALATAHLVEKAGATVAGLCFIIDLVDLKGKELLKDYDVLTLLEYEGE